MKYSQHNFDIITPVFNEVNNILVFIDNLQISLKENNINEYTIIITEDCSNDGSKELLTKFINDSKFIIINSTSRQGYSKSIQNALSYSRSDYIIFMDSDGQHNPFELNKFLNEINSGIVYGYRIKRAEGGLRNFINKLARLYLTIFVKIKSIDASCGYLLIEKNKLKLISKHTGNTFSAFWWEFSIVLSMLNLNFKQVPINHLKRVHGSGFFPYLVFFKIAIKTSIDLLILIIKMRFVKK